MAKRREDVDWYVDLSDRLERREHRRKWVALGLCVALPLVVMGSLVLYVVLERAGVITWLKSMARPAAAEKASTPKGVPVGPASVAALQKGNIRFPQLDSDRLTTSFVHVFQEKMPDKADVFTVNRETDDTGKILNYRLWNVATTDTYEFADVPVKRIGGEWTITEEGWKKISGELGAAMKVLLGAPMP